MRGDRCEVCGVDRPPRPADSDRPPRVPGPWTCLAHRDQQSRVMNAPLPARDLLYTLATNAARSNREATMPPTLIFDALREDPTTGRPTMTDTPATTPDDWDAPDAVVTYYALTGNYPTQGAIKWLNRLSDAHPEEAICRVMGEQWTEDDDPATILSRTENALNLIAHIETRSTPAETPHVCTVCGNLHTARFDESGQNPARLRSPEGDR